MRYLALLLFPIVAIAADAPPTVYAVQCEGVSDGALPVFQQVSADEGGWPVFYVPSALLRGETCAEVAATPEGDERYQVWAPTPAVRVRVEVAP